MYNRKLIIIGAGSIARSFIEQAPRNWDISVIERERTVVEEIKQLYPFVQVILGDACSRITLQNIVVSPDASVFCTTKSTQTNQEVTKLCREKGFEEIIILDSTQNPMCSNQDVQVIHPHQVIAHQVLGQLTNRITGIGMGIGEFRQVTLLSTSGAVGLPIHELNAHNWLIAAVYRNEKLIVPHGDTILEVGDQVVLVGQPEILDTEEAFIRGGQMLFPIQYGGMIGYIQSPNSEEESKWLQQNTLGKETKRLLYKDINPADADEKHISDFLVTENIGCLVLPPRDLSWFHLMGFSASEHKKLLVSAQIPVLISRGTFPYQKILLSVSNTEHSSVIVGIAFDLARQLKAELSVLTVIHPHAEAHEVEKLKELPKQIALNARRHNLEIQCLLKTGNPIQIIRNTAEDFQLLVVGCSHRTSNTFFKPDISLHLLHKTPCSTLFVPWNPTSR